MCPNRLQNALIALGDAMREMNAAIDEMRREHDPFASHIFVSCRNYKRTHDTRRGKRRDTTAMALAPGAYTAVVRGAGQSTGIGLVEAYNLDN